MSDSSFLAHFITEDIYVLKEEVIAPTASEKQAEEAPKTNLAAAVPVAQEPEAAQPAVEQPQAVEKPTVEEPTVAEPEKEESPALIEPLKAEEPEPVYLKPLPTEGNNLKHCLVLVESDAAVLESDLKGLLEKIMGAVKRSLEDILLVNVKAASEEQLEALLTEQNHRHLLAFGTQKVQVLTEVGQYEMVEISRKHYLKADSLKAISENIELKKALWKALKEMF